MKTIATIAMLLLATACQAQTNAPRTNSVHAVTNKPAAKPRPVVLDFHAQTVLQIRREEQVRTSYVYYLGAIQRQQGERMSLRLGRDQRLDQEERTMQDALRRQDATLLMLRQREFLSRR